MTGVQGMQSTAPVLPGATIGILGGGQLGKMLALEARRMGYRIVVLDPLADCPAQSLADEVVVAPLTDAAAAVQLAQLADVVTVETEHVPWTVLQQVAAVRPLRPGWQVLQVVQDRWHQREFLRQYGLPMPQCLAVSSLGALQEADTTLGRPFVLKTRTGGYDGKGQVRVLPGMALEDVWQAVGGQPCVAEAFVHFVAEVSIVLARGADGQVAAWPLAQNVHRNGILHTTTMPAQVPDAVLRAADKLGRQIAQGLDLVGVAAVELFLLSDGQLLVNEIAPRVHNSGHATLDAAATSQFEQHLRAICGLPLGSTELLEPAVMLNLLGDLWQDGPPNWLGVLGEPSARLHLYGKKDARPGRKMGHVVVLDNEVSASHQCVERMCAALGIAGA